MSKIEFNDRLLPCNEGFVLVIFYNLLKGADYVLAEHMFHVLNIIINNY